MMTNAMTRSAPCAGWDAAPLGELIDHILETHHVFLREHLPKVRARLEKILGKKPEEICGFVPDLARTFFALEEELYGHLLKEERVLFPYVKQLEAAGEAGGPPPAFHCGSVSAPIRQMEHEHENGKRAIEEMRRLTGGYPIDEGMCRNRRGLFEDLLALEADLLEHMHKENDILHVRAMELERSLGSRS